MYFFLFSQNVYYIKTEDFNLSQDGVKTEYLQQVQANEVISINEENIKQPVGGFIHGQQIHVINMPENNSRSQQATMKTPQARSVRFVCFYFFFQLNLLKEF